MDPLTPDYPWYTPYQYAGNGPIQFIDLDGLERLNPQTGKYEGINLAGQGEASGGNYTSRKNTEAFENQETPSYGITIGDYTLIGMNDGTADYYVARRISDDGSYSDEWTLGTDVESLTFFRNAINYHSNFSAWQQFFGSEGTAGYASAAKRVWANPFNWVAGASAVVAATRPAGILNRSTSQIAKAEAGAMRTLTRQELTAATGGARWTSGPLRNATKTSGRFKLEGGPKNGTLYRADNKGNVTSYIVYDAEGLAIKRVDVTGAAHNGTPTPHVLEYGRNTLPNGTVRVQSAGLGNPRPALPHEIPTN